MLEVEHLSVNYRGILALDEISFTISPGELVGLIGPNGAGKSTLVKALLGLLPMRGRALMNDRPLQQQRHRIAYIPQRSQIDWDYPITAWNVVMMANTAATGWLRKPGRQAEQQAEAALAQVEMLDLRRRQIGQLSGGQQQRVFLARALAQQADLFFFDEPFTGIDKRTEDIMLGIFARLRAQGKTLLICSHEWGDALNRYDRLLLLNRTLLANDMPKSVMTLDNIRRAYGENLQPVAKGHLEAPFFC
jgi:manganese/iron transport system ATP-binding protein